MAERILLLLLGLFLLGVGLWCLGIVARTMRRGERLEARLTDAIYRGHTKGTTTYALAVTFWYDGRQMTQECINVKSYVFAHERRIENYLTAHADEAITVWYDPARPKKTICSAGLGRTVGIFAFVALMGGVMVWIGATPGLL